MSSVRRPTAGIDFGTSTTLFATSRAGVLGIGVGDRQWMPSIAGFDPAGQLVVGEVAEAVEGSAEAAIRRSVKRAITEGANSVTLDLPDGRHHVRADDLIVALLRSVAERGPVVRALEEGATLRLACPAMWDAQQRRRLVALAQQAGLPVDLASMVEEPVAAGIAWLMDNPAPTDRPLRIVVFDMGGGTLDIAVLDVRGKELSVLAALGTPEAGDALDARVAEDLEFELARLGVDVESLPDPGGARQRLVREARTLKEVLSDSDEEFMTVDPRIFGRAGEIWYAREQLAEAFAPQLDRAEEAIELALRVARISAGAGSAAAIARTEVDDLVQGVDVVLLSGGMTNIPYVRRRLRRYFPQGTRVEHAYEPPELAVAAGLPGAGSFVRVNVFRPAFDVLVEWGGESRTLYEAFTPLVGRAQIVGGDELRYVRTGRELSLPVEGKGKLKVVSYSGKKLHASLGDRSLDGHPVSFSDKFEFSIYPDGRIRLIDGGGIADGRVEDWHHLDDADKP